jgi:predicted TIM-barrel fold metal-dependent hydrolase
VLKDFPNLYLCLAHFGGEGSWGKTPSEGGWLDKLVELMENHPNFYTDLSYYYFRDADRQQQFADLINTHPKIKEKILFGSDWYMILQEKNGSYQSYFKEMYENLLKIDEELLAYFMVINPKRFLNLEKISDPLFDASGGKIDMRDLVKNEMYSTIDQFRKGNRND